MCPPTWDDSPIVPKLVGDSLLSAEVTDSTKISRSDLIQIYDVSAQRPKTITVQELGEAFGLTFS